MTSGFEPPAERRQAAEPPADQPPAIPPLEPDPTTTPTAPPQPSGLPPRPPATEAPAPPPAAPPATPAPPAAPAPPAHAAHAHAAPPAAAAPAAPAASSRKKKSAFEPPTQPNPQPGPGSAAPTVANDQRTQQTPAVGGPRPGTPPTGAHTQATPRTDALHRPQTLRGPSRGHSDDDTTVLTPVAAKTTALDRLSVTTRKRLFVVAGASAGFALLLMVFSGFMIASATQWENRAGDLEVAAWEMGADLAEERAKVVEQQGELDLLREQLDIAQDRLTDLADEKAQEREDNENAQAAIDVLIELNSIGGAVSLALTRCANEQEALVGYLKDAASYSPADLAALEADVKTICDAARSAAAGYQAGLTE